MQNDPGVFGVIQETQGFREILFFCSPGVALLFSTRTWTCMSWIPLQQRFRVASPPLSFRSNGQEVSAFKRDNRDLRRQTSKAEDICAIRDRWSKTRWRTNPRRLFRYCDATLHVRDFRRIAAVAEAVARCMWPEKAQAMMKELYDDGFPTSREEHVAVRSHATGHHFHASAETMVQWRSLALAASAVAPSPS